MSSEPVRMFLSTVSNIIWRYLRAHLSNPDVVQDQEAGSGQMQLQLRGAPSWAAAPISVNRSL